MASTKIPLICGSKPSKFIPHHSHYKTGVSNRLNKISNEKVQGFFRYHLENEVEDDYSEDDAISLAYDDFDSASEHTMITPSGCPQSCNTSRYATKLKRIKLRLEHQKSQKFESISHNFNDYLRYRCRGLLKTQFASVSCDYGTQKMIQDCLFRENVIDIGEANKVFCSKWLNNDLIVMGTKCNQLLLYDMSTKRVDNIPCLRGHDNDHPKCEQCGIHAIDINPSGTLLATGGESSNEVGIYRLPTMDPLCTGENAHCDSVFDLCWLDDEFLVSASRDRSLALWHVDEACETETESSFHGFMQPLAKKKCLAADKVRALLFNSNRMEIVALSLNAKIHIWDATHFKQVLTQKLDLVNENVCMAKTENCSMYAIGSKSHVTLLDPRTLQSMSKIDTRKSSPNIRSMSFRGSLLTIGTGTGDLLFYDVTAGRYMERNHGSPELNCSKCNVTLESSIPISPVAVDIASDSAVYTHCYDWSGTRLFTAGGPLSAAYKGCYASIWC